MKKLLLSLAGGLLALSSSAGTLYYTGNFTSPEWDATKAIEVTDVNGVYTIPLTSKGKSIYSFKISKQKGGWDDVFNPNAICVGSGDITSGTTYTMVNGSEDINTTEGSGSAIITENNGTYTLRLEGSWAPVQQLTSAPDAYIFGNVSNWNNGDPAYKMSATDDGSNYVYTWTGSISKGVTFKIAGVTSSNGVNWSGPINYSAGQLNIAQLDGTEMAAYYNSSDMSLGDNFEGTITLKVSKALDKKNGTISFKQSSAEKTYPSSMYIIGEVNDYSWNPMEGVQMTAGENGVFTAERVNFKGYFAFTTTLGTQDGDWSTYNSGRRGPSENGTAVSAGETYKTGVYGNGDNSWQIAVPGLYNVTYDCETESFILEAVVIDYTQFYVSVTDGAGTQIAGTPELNPDETGYVKFENVAVPVGGFQIKTWDDANDIDFWYNNSATALPLGEWTHAGNAHGSVLTIAGAQEGNYYDIELDCKEGMIQVTQLSNTMYLVTSTDATFGVTTRAAGTTETAMVDEGDGYYVLEDAVIGEGYYSPYYFLFVEKNAVGDVVNVYANSTATELQPSFTDGSEMELEGVESYMSIADAAPYAWLVQTNVCDIHFSKDEGVVTLESTDNTTTGVDNVTAEDGDAPVVYYNLQGVRVANPTAGQLVIRQQGNTVTKVLVK